MEQIGRRDNMENKKYSGHQWLTPVILATQEDRGWKPAQANSLQERPYLKKTHHKKGLVEWLKV
jgi:hypothetical protein